MMRGPALFRSLDGQMTRCLKRLDAAFDPAAENPGRFGNRPHGRPSQQSARSLELFPACKAECQGDGDFCRRFSLCVAHDIENVSLFRDCERIAALLELVGAGHCAPPSVPGKIA